MLRTFFMTKVLSAFRQPLNYRTIFVRQKSDNIHFAIKELSPFQHHLKFANNERIDK